MRYKKRVKFYDEEIPIIEKGLLSYQEQIASNNEKEFFKISDMIKRLYTDEELILQKTIKSLEAKGYSVKKVEVTTQ